jgi:hypothetical protein
MSVEIIKDSELRVGDAVEKIKGYLANQIAVYLTIERSLNSCRP